MMNRRTISIIILVIFGLTILTVAVIFYFNNRKIYRNIRIKNAEIKVEIADNIEKITEGLSGRENLKANEGMLFIYQHKKERTFWMKDMRFPLDIIWIDGDKIVGIEKKVLNGGEKEKRVSPIAVNKVLEVNADFCDKNNIKVEDKVEM